MSDADDRIAVSTNGHGSPLAPPPPPPGVPDRGALPAAAPAGTDPRLVLSPGQLAAGFGVIAGIILLILGRRRGKRG